MPWLKSLWRPSRPGSMSWSRNQRARRAAELDPLIEAAERAHVLVRVGFNHRYHPAIRTARELVESGVLGELMYVRGRYGHGGRIGYDKEWRANPALSGGGELIDQGVHLIDLARWFLGDFVDVYGFVHTYYWQMPVEDNGFMLLKTAQQPGGVVACQLDGMEESLFIRDFWASRESWTSPDLVAVMAQSAWHTIACFPRWGRPRRPFGNIRWLTPPGKSNLRSWWRIFGLDASRQRVCTMPGQPYKLSSASMRYQADDHHTQSLADLPRRRRN